MKNMSKIGKLPVVLPEGVTASVTGRRVQISGPLGTLAYQMPEIIDITVTDGKIILVLKGKNPADRALFGTSRAHLANMVRGVSSGWLKQLELVGTGFRAETSGQTLILTVGYSHPVKIEAPVGVTFKVEKNVISVSGPGKDLVGQIAANIRAVRPPEPYKGKGIKYVGEIVRRKAGKAAKTAGATA